MITHACDYLTTGCKEPGTVPMRERAGRWLCVHHAAFDAPTTTKTTHTPWRRDSATQPTAAPCGCIAERRYRVFRGQDAPETRIIYCPTHAAAPELLAALQWAMAVLDGYAPPLDDEPLVRYERSHVEARALLTRIENGG